MYICWEHLLPPPPELTIRMSRLEAEELYHVLNKLGVIPVPSSIAALRALLYKLLNEQYIA